MGETASVRVLRRQPAGHSQEQKEGYCLCSLLSLGKRWHGMTLEQKGGPECGGHASLGKASRLLSVCVGASEVF